MSPHVSLPQGSAHARRRQAQTSVWLLQPSRKARRGAGEGAGGPRLVVRRSPAHEGPMSPPHGLTCRPAEWPGASLGRAARVQRTAGRPRVESRLFGAASRWLRTSSADSHPLALRREPRRAKTNFRFRGCRSGRVRAGGGHRHERRWCAPCPETSARRRSGASRRSNRLLSLFSLISIAHISPQAHPQPRAGAVALTFLWASAAQTPS